MSPLRVVVRGFVLPLHSPLATAHGAIESRSGFLIEVEDEGGVRGFGEATPLPAFGTEDLAACRRGLEEGAARIADASSLDDDEVWRGLPWSKVSHDVSLDPLESATKTPCADFGLSTALADLSSRRDGCSLPVFLHAQSGFRGDVADSVASQALIGGRSPEEVHARAREAAGAGFDAFKLKLAVDPSSRDLDLDIERVAALREVVGEDARIRLDANEAWSVAEAARALGALAAFSIDYIEQPVAASDLLGLRWLSENGEIAVAADEALLGAGLRACLAQRAAEILIVKPAAIGSLAVCRALIQRAREDGLRLVWSTLIDGAVGRNAAIALAAAFGPADEVHGLGTAGLLSADFLNEPESPRAGRLYWQEGPGLGFDPDIHADLAAPQEEESLASFEVDP